MSEMGRRGAAELTAADIQWHLAPLPDDSADPNPLVDALIEGMAYRTVMQEALQALAALTDEHHRLEHRYFWLLHRRRHEDR